MKKVILLILAAILGLAAPLLAHNTSLAADETLVVPGKDAWPADKIPADIPPYAGGKVATWGDTGDGEFMIKIAETTPQELNAYLENLEAKGWDVQLGTYANSARKGAYALTLAIQSKTWLQITVHTAKQGAWPGADKLPPVVTPPRGCALLDTRLIPQGGDDWRFVFTCQGMGEQEANAYMEELLKNGWAGDQTQLGRETNWRGKRYGLMLEIYEIAGGSASFALNFSPEY